MNPATIDILEFLNDNKDALGPLFGSGIVVAALTAIISFAVWIIRSCSANRKRIDTKPFKIIPPCSDFDVIRNTPEYQALMKEFEGKK